MTEIEGYWFAASDELPHGDGRKVVLGETLRVDGKLIPCKRGLHASVDPFDALQYAPGPLLYKVRLSGTIIPHEDDKHVASERTALDCRDATDMLRLFARRQALSIIHLWAAPAVVREYLETGDESKRAAAEAAAWAPAGAAAGAGAWAPAWDAARAAARAAAGAAAGAAWVAARDTALGTAWAAARDTAWAAARAAAWAAAGDTAWDAARAAARAAAGAAARDAADAAARKMFNEMVADRFNAGEAIALARIANAPPATKITTKMIESGVAALDEGLWARSVSVLLPFPTKGE